MKKALELALGLSFPTKKFKDLLEEALSDLKCTAHYIPSKIKNATFNITMLLKAGQHDYAYSKVKNIIQKQNQYDAYNVIIGYLPILIDDVDSFKSKSDIPEEHLEAVSNLIFAAPRIKLLSPHHTAIQDVRKILLSHFSENLVVQYLERNNCGINPQIIEKLSEEASLREVRMKLLEEIAAKENIVLELKGNGDSSAKRGKMKQKGKKKKHADEVGKALGNSSKVPEDIVELLAKDVYIKRSPEETRHVDHMVTMGEEIAANENIVLKPKEASTSTKEPSDNSELTSEDEIRKSCVLSDPAKRGKKNQNGEGKQMDMADPEKPVGDSANSSSEVEKKKHTGKQKHNYMSRKAVGSSFNDARSESERQVSDSDDIDEDTAKLLNKDVYISYSMEESLDHYKNNAHSPTAKKSGQDEKARMMVRLREKSRSRLVMSLKELLGNPSND